MLTIAQFTRAALCISQAVFDCPGPIATDHQAAAIGEPSLSHSAITSTWALSVLSLHYGN